MKSSRALVSFHTVHTEGGLLPLDLLQRIVLEDKTLPGLSDDAYHLLDGERLRDAMNRSWSQLTTVWKNFKAAEEKLPATDRANVLTRDKWLLPLFHALSFGRLTKAPEEQIDGKTYAISHHYNHSPIHFLGCRTKLDDPQKDKSGRTITAHGLVQDYLNRSEGHLWGFVSNGFTLRILRDHHSLTQQAYVEFDLQAMMEGEHFSEFCLLWLLCHQSRVDAEKPEECWLEKWFQQARDEGVRALDKLRDGVEKAIMALGTGFLKHKANKKLQRELEEGTLDKQEFYRLLLRLVYRLIFLFVAEDREVLHDTEKSTPEARDRYQRWYATWRLRELADKRRGGPHGDAWQGLLLVMRKLATGSSELALPALGSFLWRQHAIGVLDECELSNEYLFAALRELCYTEHGKSRYPVSWRNIGSEELGSVYESLLERHPKILLESAHFELDTAAGHERKTTGSYYTPKSLVECLLDSALDPVLDEAAQKGEQAILNLKVCDPACGSGHFLVAAARRMATRLATVRTGGDEPSPRDVRHALRDVVGRCIYGVDLNPMAVELCKVSLWMEAIEPGKPLSFLEAHIRQGNALLGATPKLMDGGIPDEAFEVIEGDDKDVAKRLKKRNKDERKGQTTLFSEFAKAAPMSYGRLSTGAAAVEADGDGDLAAVEKKEADWDRFTESKEYTEAWLLADAWCAAFVWPKEPKFEDAAITHDVFQRMKHDVGAASKTTRKKVQELSQGYSFFHWHLAFPQVFLAGQGVPNKDEATGWAGGFDVVLGNPPWERIKIQEEEFFSSRNETIANATNAAARKKLIAALPKSDPALWSEWCAESRQAEGQSQLVRQSGRYPLCGKGDVNTYALFAEHNRSVVGPKGRAGFIVPTGIATDDTTKEYFAALVQKRQLASLYDFQNTAKGNLFREIGHDNIKFVLLTLASSGVAKPDLVFYALNVSDLRDARRKFSLTSEDIAILNPNTRTCPTFRSRRDADINLALYQRAGVLWREDDPNGNPWGLRFMAMLHMANDSGLFRTRTELETAGWKRDKNHYVLDQRRMVPLVEAKMVHHFDHRFGDYADRPAEKEGTDTRNLPLVPAARLADPNYAPTPRYWVAESEIADRVRDRWRYGWLVGWRDICRSIDQRTVIASLIPRVGVGHTTPLLFTSLDPRLIAALYANLCSFLLDYAARQKIGGTHLTYGYLKQLPILAPDVYAKPAPWAPDQSLRDWILPRVLELTYTAWDLEPFAKDCGYDGPPFRWEPERRALLRAELDAAFFHVCGINREDTDYIMETFPVVKKNDERSHGDYRTKRLVLEAYDRLKLREGMPCA